MISKKKKSQKQEERLATVFKGGRTPGSGSKWYCKSDVKCRDFRIEAKYTDQGKFKFSLCIWNKIREEAIKTGKIPLLCVMLRGGGIGVHRNFVIFNKNDFEEFIHEEYEESFVMNRVVNMDVGFILNHTPFELVSKSVTFVMMRERDFLDTLGIV